jgi:uncharacterized DUF497 family protein
MRVSGFDCDDGNHLKVLKHGVTRVDIEQVFMSQPYVEPDLRHSDFEERYNAVGQTASGRYVFVVFTFRLRNNRSLIRPISARFMHQKEIKAYEKAVSKTEDRS